MQIAARPEVDLSPFEGNGLAPRDSQNTEWLSAEDDPAGLDAAKLLKRGSPRSRSLQINILAITLSSVLAILLVFFTYLETTYYQDASNQIDQKIIRMIDGGSAALANVTARKNGDEVRLVLAPILGDPDVVSVALTLMDGTRLAEQGNPLDDIETYMVFRRAITHAVKGDPTQIGWVHVGITHRRIDEELRARLWIDAILASLILIAVVVGSFQSLRMTVMRPLRTLMSAIEGWEVNDDHRPVVYSRNDEFGELIASFNQMQQRQRYYQDSLRISRDMAESGDQTKTAFLAIIDHEWRTKLNAIIGSADLLKRQMSDAERARYGGPLDRIYNSGDALLDMVNDILEITHAQSGKLKLVEEPLLLRNLVEQAVASCVEKANGDIAEIDNAVPPEIPQIYTDPVRLGRMVFHLVSNAIRFTPAGGHIRIDATFGDDGLSLCISDTGPGISQDKLVHLEKLSAHLSNDWSHHGEGAGLGLTYVRQMAQRLGGAFILESEVGKGTTVTVRLPPKSPK